MHMWLKNYTLKWSKICCPKSWEGLGIRRFSLLN